MSGIRRKLSLIKRFSKKDKRSVLLKTDSLREENSEKKFDLVLQKKEKIKI